MMVAGFGVDEHNFVALLLEGLAGLGAGIVELGGLADDDGARADYEDFLNVISARHSSAFSIAQALRVDQRMSGR